MTIIADPEGLKDGRLTADSPSVRQNIRIREAAEEQKRLGRPLTDQELVKYISSVEYYDYIGSVEFSDEDE